MKTKIVFFSSEIKDSLITDGALSKRIVCARQIELIVLCRESGFQSISSRSEN